MEDISNLSSARAFLKVSDEDKTVEDVLSRAHTAIAQSIIDTDVDLREGFSLVSRGHTIITDQHTGLQIMSAGFDVIDDPWVPDPD